MKFRRLIALIAGLAMMLSAVIGGSPAAQAAAPAPTTTPVVQSAPVDRMVSFTIEVLPSKKAAPPSKCTVERSYLVLPYEWPWAQVTCKSGSGTYRVKGVFVRIINGKKYTKKGPIVKVGKTSRVYADGGFDYAIGAAYYVM